MSGRRNTAGAAGLWIVLGAAALAVAVPAHAGAPPDVAGKKYSDAQTALKSAGFTSVVSTTVGDQKSWPDCLVTNVVVRTQAAPENTSASPVSQALVSLNCYGTEASANKSGYSAASTEGRAIVAQEKKDAASAKSS